MKTLAVVALSALVASACPAQHEHQVPFASSGNSIDLQVQNGSAQLISGVTVTAYEIPTWMHIDRSEQNVNQLKPNGKKEMTFVFSVDRAAPVNVEGRVTFLIRTSLGGVWRKEVDVSVAPPTQYELLQNYPNPFNPNTRIEYIVPKASDVSLQVYNVMGEKVSDLAQGYSLPGSFTVEFDASNFASGIYFYRLVAGSYVHEKKMILMK